ncbi:carbohydrate ABC transporter permease [Agromyces atrinae]|uniref:Multiple sugar transport system permease protein n=2 Tax=Agromyces atrinae TaxID=592376 RepID=A0A852SF35_9MICO|nr:carbohydrate ABC transporter permease [Agromyces atrinae]NYD67433.1 multiple sugar transport system permease protein [Agromyces atrinae]
MTTTGMPVGEAVPAPVVDEIMGRESRAERRRQRRLEEDAPVGYKKSKWSQILVLVALGAIAFYSIAPVWWLIVSATKSGSDLYNSNGLWFSEFTLWDNLVQLATYKDGIFFRWLGNSIFYAGTTAIVTTFISIAAGYGLSKFVFRGQRLGMAIVIGSFLVPGALLTVPLYVLFANLGILNTPWAVLLPGFISAFNVYLAKVYVDGAVPDELLEASRLDGAGELRIFFSIVMRLMVTGGATIFLLSFVGSWNGFFLPLTMLRGQDQWTVSLGLYSWLQTRADQTVDLTSLTITGALLSTIPLVIFMVSMSRYWRTGVTLGAVK